MMSLDFNFLLLKSLFPGLSSKKISFTAVANNFIIEHVETF